MQGPGAYDNLGNALGLTAGIVFQVVAAHGEAGASLVEAVRDWLAVWGRRRFRSE